MFESWKQLEGSIVNEKLRLGRYLGGSDVGGLFLVDEGEVASKTAIKLLQTDPQRPETQLFWLRSAEKLSHPNLIRVFQVGRCQAANIGFFYVVMEYAEENLGQILPYRTLAPEEAHALLMPLLDVLAFLHGHGLVHGHIKPANILAIEDQIKLSSDRLYGSGELGSQDRLSIYSPPEAAAGEMSPAGDVWSLGITLVEVLAGYPPVWERKDQEDPLLPETIPQPFLDLARNCLRRDPRRRWTVAEIANFLRKPSPMRQGHPTPETRIVSKKRPYALVASLAALALAVTLGGLKLGRPSGTDAPAISGANVQTEARQESQLSETTSISISDQEIPDKTVHAAIPLSMRETVPVTHEPAAVIHRVLPQVSPLALRTIRGTVRVGIKLDVDPSGSVAETSFDSPGPSKYFADRAMEATRLWKFKPAEIDGQNVASQWVLRFEYSNAGTTVHPVQTAPNLAVDVSRSR